MTQLIALLLLSDFEIAGPYTHENLAVFLVRGKDQTRAAQMIPLAAALKAKQVRVTETGEVNELVLDNTSDKEVFVQAGDIVRGGRQDRTLGMDLVLPPKTNGIKIAAFCVEHGRWQQRGKESSSQFSGSENALATKALKMAVREEKNQSAVWKKVEEAQKALAAASPESPSSLELTLEHADVKTRVDAYVAALGDVANEPNAIGFAFAVNGTINTAEVYGSSDLFRAMWPKLLRAAATEALTQVGKARKVAQAADVDALLAPANKNATVYETKSPSKNEMLHRSYYAH